MGNRPLSFATSAPLTIAELEYQAKGWLLDGEVRRLSCQRQMKNPHFAS
jgi:hypothetical protein